MTERTGPDEALHYLHVVPGWPSNGKLDYSKAYELGSPGVTRVESGAIYFYHAGEGEIEKYIVNESDKVEPRETISFVKYGIMGYDPEPIWVSPERAFLLDEKTGQIARWNPKTMLIDYVERLNPDVLKRDGLKVQFQLGIAAAGRLFTTVNWRDWDTGRVVPAATLGVFDANAPAGGPQQLVQDTRCAPSVAVGAFRDAEGYVYLVGDGANGYDMLASKMRSQSPQCVVRMREDANAFDPAFFVDLQAVTKSPAITMVYPMGDHKLLASMWSPEVDVAPFIDPKSSDWFWKPLPYYEYAIIDLIAKTSTRVTGLPRGPKESNKVLIVDGKNYVQQFRADRSSTLHRVDADGTVTLVLDNAAGANVQYIGRL